MINRVGIIFQNELVASVRAVCGEEVALRCRIPDEKRQRRADGSYPTFHGEVRVADLVVILPGGRTVWVEAKATGRHDPIAHVRPRQWASLRFLAERGHEAWLVLNWRTTTPPFLNECYAMWAGVALERDGRSIARPWAEAHGIKLERTVVGTRGGWGWDIRPIVGQTNVGAQ